jgi:excisionase family DNA binding protein
MKTYYPNLLTRQRAMQMLDCTRTKLEKLVQENNLRTYKTTGGHNRYFRDDLTKYTTTLTKQNNG